MWQITRKTLLYAHKLYLKDTRDYSRLPPRLQTRRELNPDDADPAVLTTYSGLLFRNLLDQFHGDVARAVGAYNGGPGNPNQRYERESAWSRTTPGASWNMLASMAARPSE
jgi:hypothetical protein